MPETQELETKQGFKKTKLGWIPMDWELKKFSAIANISMGQSPKGNTYNGEGIGIPLINGPTEFTERYPIKKQWTSTPTKICNKGDILICVRGSSTGRINISNDNYCIGRGIAAIKATDKTDQNYIESQLLFAVDRILKLTSGSTFPNISSTDLKNIDVLIPNLIEQKAIANCLSTWDTAITKLDALIQAKQQLKKALMQQMLSGKKRLPGFDEEWEEKRLDYFFNERSERNNEDLPLLSIGEAGVYPQDDSNKKDTSNKDKSKYKRIYIGDIGYNTMRMWQGRSALSTLEGIVSPAYTIVKPKKNTDSRFFAYLFKDSAIIHRFYRNSQGMVSDTLNCKFKDFAPIKLVLPTSREEQTAIAQVLNTADKEIKLITTQREQLHAQKKGLMQQLLTGKKRLNF